MNILILAFALLSAADADCADCEDGVTVGQMKRGGATALSSTSTGAVAAAQNIARDKACAASKRTLGAAAPCPDPTRCQPAGDTATCDYTNDRCPARGTFASRPNEWVAACQDSTESDAWKAAHCTLHGTSGGKPHFAICTVEATAKRTTRCVPHPSCAEDEDEDENDELRMSLTGDVSSSDCGAAGCTDETDTESAGGSGSAIGATSAAAVADGLKNAEDDALAQACALVQVPECRGGCTQLGEVHLVPTLFPGTSTCTRVFRAWDEPDDQDRDPRNGISDFWAAACWRMAGRNPIDHCARAATENAKPFYAYCVSHAHCTGTRVCVDAACAADAEESEPDTGDTGQDSTGGH
jgi:hypothetical protein